MGAGLDLGQNMSRDVMNKMELSADFAVWEDIWGGGVFTFERNEREPHKTVFHLYTYYNKICLLQSKPLPPLWRVIFLSRLKLLWEARLSPVRLTILNLNTSISLTLGSYWSKPRYRSWDRRMLSDKWRRQSLFDRFCSHWWRVRGTWKTISR